MFPCGIPGPDRLSRYGGLPAGAHRYGARGVTKGLVRPGRDRPRGVVPASVRHFLPSAVDQQAHLERWRTQESLRG